MYQGHLNIYLLGAGEAFLQAMEAVDPLEPFTHTFVAGDAFDIQTALDSDLILCSDTVLGEGAAGASGDDHASELGVFLKEKAGGVDVIALTETGRLSEALERALSGDLSSLTDIWPSDASPHEIQWRFTKWLEQRKVSADAQEAAQFLEVTINSIPCLVWYKTKDGVHEKVNDSFCETVGKTKDDVEGRRHAYIWDVEEDDPACIESEAQVMATKKTFVSEETVQTGEGQKLLTTYKSPLFDLDGSVMGTVGVAIDITQERSYEHDLVQKNHTLETIFTAMDCGVLTHSLDGKRVLGVNQAALNILGYKSAEDMIERGFNMVADSVLDEDKELLRNNFAKLKHVGDSISNEYRILHDDGNIIHVLGNAKLIEKDGELLYQRFLLDYSDQKREEMRRVKRQQSFVRALAEKYILVCSYDLNTGKGELLRITDDADAELRSIFEKELDFSESLNEYIDKRVWDEDKPLLREALFTEDLLTQLADRERFTVMFRSFVDGVVGYRQLTVVQAGSWDSDDDNERRVVLGLNNVDKQIREEMHQKELLSEALERAERANAAKTLFLSNMSHDIRTPMNAIVGFTTLANSHIDQPDRVQEYLEKIQMSSSHLLSLINDILDMSRIESGKITIDPRSIDLNKVFTDIESILQSEVQAKDLSFDMDTAGVKHRFVNCDNLKLNQILLNLLGNAIKFTPAGGKVSLKVEERTPSASSTVSPSSSSEGPIESDEGCHAGAFDKGAAPFSNFVFIVTDNGIGMDQEFLQHIFDPFERERTSTLSGIQGTGLGMSITKSLVDRMDGTITVKSRKGEGSEFQVVLPFELIDEARMGADAESYRNAGTVSETLRGCRVLLVDDNMLNREIAATLLEDVGFNVEQAVDGQDAIDKLLDADPGYYQLVLMDIQMPVMNGYEATEIIRGLEDRRIANIPILAVTADAFEEDKQKALDCGMNGHIAKPIEVDALFEMLDNMLTGQ